ncbi:Ig-like domain-containing protein, partial [Vreelandella titanicae]
MINAAEAEQNFTAVSGTVSGDVVAGDQVTLSVNGNSYTTSVVDDGAGNLSYSTTVATADLIADNSVEASVTATDAAGNSQTATETRDITVNTDASATITIDTIAGDDVINGEEATQTISVTGSVGGDAGEGDTVTLSVGDES